MPSNFLDELAFGPGRNWRALGRGLLLALAIVAIAAGILYLAVSGDYAHLRANVYTGATGGQYYATGERLEARARKKNGRLTVVPTAGSVENVAKLAGENGRCEPAFAFVQDGVPIPTEAGLQTLGRLPHPESLLLLSKRNRPFENFGALKGASIGIGPEGSGTAYLMHELLQNPDLRDLDLKPSNHPLATQVQLVEDGKLDLAAFVIDENAPVVREAMAKHDLDIVSPLDEEGLVARNTWLSLGRIPAGFYDVNRPSPATDKAVAQVETLVMANGCVGRAQRVAFLSLLAEEFPDFVKSNPPPTAKALDDAPLADEAREFFANGQPQIADRYFPWAVNLMSPAYWIYLAMAVTVLLNGSEVYSRFRLWRIDASRERLESQLKTLVGLGPAVEHMKALPPDATLKTSADFEAANRLGREFEALRVLCLRMLNSLLTPMGREMYYRYQEHLIVDSQAMVKELIQRSGGA